MTFDPVGAKIEEVATLKGEIRVKIKMRVMNRGKAVEIMWLDGFLWSLEPKLGESIMINTEGRLRRFTIKAMYDGVRHGPDKTIIIDVTEPRGRMLFAFALEPNASGTVGGESESPASLLPKEETK